MGGNVPPVAQKVAADWPWLCTGSRKIRMLFRLIAWPGGVC